MKNLKKTTNVDIVSAFGMLHSKASTQSEEGPTLKDLFRALLMLPILFIRRFKRLPVQEQREIIMIMVLILLLLPALFLFFYLVAQFEK